MGTGERGIATRQPPLPPPLTLVVVSSSLRLLGREETLLEVVVDGFPIGLESRIRKASYKELFRGGDILANLNVRTSEFMDTALLPARSSRKCSWATPPPPNRGDSPRQPIPRLRGRQPAVPAGVKRQSVAVKKANF